MTCVQQERTHGDFHRGRTPCEDRGRDWSDAFTSQRMPMIAGREGLGERPGTNSPSEPPEENNLTDILILDFKPPKLWENKFLLFWATQFVVICYGSPTKLIWFPIIFITKIPQASLTSGQAKSHTCSNNSDLIGTCSHFLMHDIQALWKDFPLLTIKILYFWVSPGRVSWVRTNVCPSRPFHGPCGYRSLPGTVNEKLKNTRCQSFRGVLWHRREVSLANPSVLPWDKGFLKHYWFSKIAF